MAVITAGTPGREFKTNYGFWDLSIPTPRAPNAAVIEFTDVSREWSEIAFVAGRILDKELTEVARLTDF
jgi:hypothetical protein